MALIKARLGPAAFFAAFFFLAGLCPLAGQIVPLGPEIERLRHIAETPALKYTALVRLARLFTLSGDREGAFETWLAAADAAGTRGGAARLEAAKILVSIGEFDRARAELAKASSGPGGTTDAELLSAHLEAFAVGNAAPLSGLASLSGYTAGGSGILYTLWKVSGNEAYKTRLVAAFPRSIEAEIAAGTPGVKPAATPQWLFFTPRGTGVSVAARVTIPAAPQSAAFAESPPPAEARLQTGLFSREANAAAMAEKLAAAGFRAEVVSRVRGGGEYWAVCVPAGANVNLSISQLKRAGFESFPVFY